jgi:hypothetical protein
METPDRWVVVKLPDGHKVFATWLGGYLDGDAWKMNSGIKSVTEDEQYYYFHGFSGSIYKCHKSSYGTSGYSQGVLDGIFEKAKSAGFQLEVLTEDFNFITLA